MIIYSVRALNIIEILKNSHDPVSSLALSEEIGCSTKTIQSEIKDINKNSKDGKIVSIRGIGYKIEGSFDYITIPSPYLGNVDRIDYIIKSLINLTKKQDNTVKLEELADSMYISVSTVKNDLKEVIFLLENHGYIYEGDLGLKDREAFRYEGKEHLRIHHLYVCPQDSKELKRHLAFRNYLRNHPNTVKEYGKVKKEAAKLFPNDTQKYCMYKSQIIEKIYKEIGL